MEAKKFEKCPEFENLKCEIGALFNVSFVKLNTNKINMMMILSVLKFSKLSCLMYENLKRKYMYTIILQKVYNTCNILSGLVEKKILNNIRVEISIKMTSIELKVTLKEVLE